MSLEKNIDADEKQKRLISAAVFAVLAVITTGLLDQLFWLIAIYLVVTAVLEFCPGYKYIGKPEGGIFAKLKACGKGGCSSEKKAAPKEDAKKEESDKAAE